MERILVLRGGALGDFIVTLPALATLRRQWPSARIELAGNATAAALGLARGLLDAVHSQHEARWATLYGGAPLPEPFGAWLDSFDLVLSYWPDPEGEIAARFSRHGRPRFLCAAALPERAPAAAHFQSPIGTLGVDNTAVFHRLEPRSAPPGLLAPGTVAFHPGSGSSRKNWPQENWRALIESIDAPGLLLLGEVELPAWRRVPLPSRIQTLAHAPLETVVTHLASCGAYIGHDSGISHLAAACGVPSLLLFGPTDPRVWAPPAPHVRVLQAGAAVSDLSLDEVLGALNRMCREHT